MVDSANLDNTFLKIGEPFPLLKHDKRVSAMASETSACYVR